VNQALVDLPGRIGERKNAAPAQITLAWLPAQKQGFVSIPGTIKLHRLASTRITKVILDT
jgi:aryl-alcohol dehydrogenase-like predicted oxidoreductase